ncbi:MAG: hypothetical protein KDI29_01920, partial [Pseudomonadales bacterium]|nr:hypothetical protein [Pseudomonadales bacterium]
MYSASARYFSVFIVPTLLMLFSGGLSAAEDSAGDSPPTFASALEASIRLRSEVDRFREQIVQQELQFGPYDRSLVEPLNGLNDVLIELQAYDEVDANLNRILMLLRTLDGPASLEQIPVLETAIRNDIRRRDWESVTQRFEFMHYLFSQNETDNAAVQLEARDELIKWHLTALYLDDKANRLQHFTEAMELQRQNLNLAEETFDTDNPQLIPWLYRSAVQKFRVYSILNADDELGLDARRAIIGGYYMEDQLNQIQQYIYSPVPGRGPRNYLEEELRRARLEGLGLIKQIREILSSADDPEAEAMAIVYEADFQLLLDRGSAARSYREAMDQLAAAGVNEDRIAEFFSRPSALPEPEFHTRLEVALSAQDQRGYDVSSAPDRINLGTFVAWNESLASAQRPALPTAA